MNDNPQSPYIIYYSGLGLYLLSLFMPASTETMVLEALVLGALWVSSAILENTLVGLLGFIGIGASNVLMILSPFFIRPLARGEHIWFRRTIMVIALIVTVVFLVTWQLVGKLPSIGFFLWAIAFPVVAWGLYALEGTLSDSVRLKETSSDQIPKASLTRRHVLAGLGVMIGLATLAVAWLSDKGEHVSYRAWTNIGPGFTNVEIVRIGAGTKHLFSASKIIRYDTPGPSFGGMAYMADTGHMAPDEVEISWRKWPREGQKWYNSDPVDPVRIKVRSRIPKRVLKMIRQKGIRVELSFGIGQEPTVLCWRVRDFNQAYGTKILEQGGDNPACKR